MDQQRSRSYCDECGIVQGNHFLLWLDGWTDAMSVAFPAHKIPFYNALLGFVDWLMVFIGRLLFKVGPFVKFISLSRDPARTVSDRSRLLMEEALRRSYDIEQLVIAGNPTDTFRVRHKGRSYFFKSLPLPVSAHALQMDDKVLFKKKMEKAELPVPKSYSVRTLGEAKEALRALSNVCVKPRTGSNGRHTYPYVKTEDELERVFRSVRSMAPYASVEEHLEGNLCRATCVDGKMIGFLESEHPHIVGDGVLTVSELINAANAKKLDGTKDVLVGSSIEGYIRRRGYSPDSVLPRGEKLQLTYRGGRSVASTNREHGRSIHPSFIPFIERAAVETELPVVGFDIIIPDPMRPEHEQTWGFIEANSLPWIDLHAMPYFGEPNDLSGPVWDMWETTFTRSDR